MGDTFTLIDEGRISSIAATISNDHVRLAPDALKAALGWELKPQGLCKDDRCVPIGRHSDRVNADGIDVAAVAELLGRPLAIDLPERVACLGTSAAQRAAQLASLEAPDFTLPDLNGRLHRLSDYRGKKVFLVAYASW
jgi:hypothetical protein